MMKHILFAILVTLFSLQSFAIVPGAGQAQMRNNMQQMEQNKQQIKQMQQNQDQKILKQKKLRQQIPSSIE